MLGSIAATLGVVLPSVVSILAILLFLGRIEDNIYVKGAFEGVTAASAALIAVAAWRMGKEILKGKLEYGIAAVSFLLILFAGISAVWAIVLGGLAGVVSHWYQRRKGGVK
jgi:chromate transporter